MTTMPVRILPVRILAVAAALSAPAAALHAQPATGQEAALALQTAFVEAIAKAEQSVVAIARVSKERDFAAPPFGGRDEALSPDFIPAAYGTGVVIDRRGLILTNFHVLGDVEKYDFFVWHQRRAYKAVKVEAADPWLDLAVLRIAADDLKPIQFGDAGKLKKGQLVVALGNPHAIARDGEVSASWGIISNLKRAAPPLAGVDPPGDKDTLHHYGTLIQTDARLSQGASGGALINLKGEMIGLTSSLAALSSGEGNAGFAIPVNDTFKRDVDVLKLGRVPDFGFLGVSLDEVSTELALSGARGAIISAVVCAPAAGSGLFDGDLVTRINDEPIASRSDLFREVGSLPPGAEMEIGVVRNGRPIAPISVKLSKKYPLTSRPPYASVAPSKWRGLQVDYATAVPSDVLNLRRFDLDVAGCVVISSVEQDSSAWKAGLRRWTFVSHVGETRVDNPEAFHRAVNGLAGDVRLRLSTQTGGELRSVPAE